MILMISENLRHLFQELWLSIEVVPSTLKIDILGCFLVSRKEMLIIIFLG